MLIVEQMIWLTKCRYTDYTIYDFLDKTSLLKLMTINKMFLNHDDYFKHRLQQWARYKPERFCYREWWKFLIVNRIPYLTNNNIFEFGLKNELPTLVDYALTQPQSLSLMRVFDIAIEFGRYDLVKQFHLCGADIFTMNHHPLRRAARKGYLDIVQYLVRHKADVNVNNDEPLRNSVYADNIEVINYLLECGAAVHYLTVEVIIDNANTKILKFLLDHEKVRQPHIIQPAIEYSVSCGQSEIFEFLMLYIIEHKLAVENWLIRTLCSASLSAANKMFAHCLNYAKTHNLNIEDGLTEVFFLCIQNRSYDLIAQLIKFSPQLESGITQLILDKLMFRLGEIHYLNHPSVEKLVNFAVRYKIDIRSCLNFGLIQKCCDLYWVKFFVTRGADINYNNGQALKLATMEKKSCVVEYLKEHGAVEYYY